MRAREKARQSNCLSNVKQMNLAWLQYVQDYDETSCLYGYRIPPGSGVYYYFSSAVPAQPTRTGFLDPYLKNTRVTLCPSRMNQTRRHFGINHSHISGQFAGAALAQIEYPAETLLFCDNQNQLAGCPCSQNPAYTPGLARVPHNDGINVGFVDGHARWMKPDGGAGTGAYAGMTGLKGYWYDPYGGIGGTSAGHQP